MIIDSPRRREHLLAIAQRMPEHVAKLSWTADQIEAERTLRLREVLKYARNSSPWYASSLSGIDISQITPRDMQRLPTLTKAAVMQNWDDIVTDRRLKLDDCNRHIQGKLHGRTRDYYYLDTYEIFATGGSSGTRGVFVWGWNEFIEIACITFRYQYRDEVMQFSDKRGLLAVIEAGETVHGSPFLFSVTPHPDMQVRWFPAATPLRRLVCELNEAQPTHINCFASTVHELAAAALAGELSIKPIHLSTNSEPLTPEARDAARNAWGIEINNMWGCVEVGHIGIECDRHEGLHMSDDAVITEFVDENNEPTQEPDRIAKVLVTSLFNHVQPIIRYEITDVAIPSPAKCSCGAAYPLIGEIRGRSDDVFRYADSVSVHPLVYRTPLGQHPMIEQYQVHQTAKGAKILIIVRGSVDCIQLTQDIVTEVEKAGLKNPEIEICIVDMLQRHSETGKLKRFIPLKA